MYLCIVGLLSHQPCLFCHFCFLSLFGSNKLLPCSGQKKYPMSPILGLPGWLEKTRALNRCFAIFKAKGRQLERLEESTLQHSSQAKLCFLSLLSRVGGIVIDEL